MSDRSGEDGPRARGGPRRGFGLSWKLLVLTILYVMISEVLIYVPSIANFRTNWLLDRMTMADAASSVLAESVTAEVPRGIQPGLVLVAIFHARGGVEHQRRGHRRLLAAHGPGQPDARASQCERQQCDDRRTQQQQQQVPQPEPPLVHVVPLLEKPQGGELQQRRPAAHDQVQHNRHGDQCASGQK